MWCPVRQREVWMKNLTVGWLRRALYSLIHLSRQESTPIFLWYTPGKSEKLSWNNWFLTVFRQATESNFADLFRIQPNLQVISTFLTTDSPHIFNRRISVSCILKHHLEIFQNWLLEDRILLYLHTKVCEQSACQNTCKSTLLLLIHRRQQSGRAQKSI